MKKSLIIKISAVGVVLLVGIFIALNFQNLMDCLAGFGYAPSPEMSEIKSSLVLTGDGERIFNASRPVLEPQDNFNEVCDSHVKETSVLGCYTNRTVHIYDIKSDELKGVKESTTAHEFLHAVWARLSDSEKTRLGELLDRVYQDSKYHEVLEKDLKTYSENEQKDELHSRVGTEIKDLPDELEKHYAKYFNDQDKIVDFYQSYIKPFETLRNQIETLAETLEKTKSQIDTKTSEYKTRAEALNSAISEFNNCAETLNCFTVRSDFNTRRSELVAEQTAVNDLYTDIDTLVKDYNAKVEEYNSNILKNKNLEDVINSNSKVNNL